MTSDLKESAVNFSVYSAIWLFMAAAAFPIYSAYRWLRYGIWERVSVNSAVGFFEYEVQANTTFVGLNRIIDWYLNTNVGWTLLAISIAALWIADAIEESARINRSNKAQDATPGGF